MYMKKAMNISIWKWMVSNTNLFIQGEQISFYVKSKKTPTNTLAPIPNRPNTTNAGFQGIF